MKQNLRILVGALVGTVTLGVGVALAEDTQPQMPMTDQGMMGGQGMGPGMMGQYGMGMMGHGVMNDMGPMMEGRLAYMKAELGITAEQTAAWGDYAKAVKERVSSMQKTRTEMMKVMHSGSALDRLDARTKAMENMVESLKAVRPAVVALYNALTADQKKKADALIGMDCCMI